MHRFFIDPSQLTASTATITGEEARHLSLVLRLKAGAEIALFDGAGTIHQARLEHLGRDKVVATILSSRSVAPTPPFVHLGQALLKGKKMELVIQKATELGIHGIHPFTSEFCTVKHATAAKDPRWDRIVSEACKQSGRPLPPRCETVTDFRSILAQAAAFDTKIILWEKEESRPLSFANPATIHSVLLLVGSEGGFTDGEVAAAIAAGFTPVTLGQQILRAETAAISVMAISQFLLGNLDKSN